jgi:hypothetical protein
MSADLRASEAPACVSDPLTAREAVAWRRERDKREPAKRDLKAERRSLIRDFIAEALTPACNDLDACLLALDNDDDVAGAYHLRRVIVSIKHAAHGFRDLAA